MKNNVYPCKPQFYYIKMGFTGSKLYRHVVFVMLHKQTAKVLVRLQGTIAVRISCNGSFP